MIRDLALPHLAATALALLLCGAARAQVLESTLTASDASFGDLFGNAIGIDGDTVIAGARADGTGTGSAYVFRSNGVTWTQEGKLTATGAAVQDQVGFAVSLDAEVTVLGAPDPFDPFGPPSGPGSAYVFRRSGTLWTEEAEVAAGDGLATDQFGYSVSVSGDACVIGARGDQDAGPGSRASGRGSAYVFREIGLAWSQETKLLSGDGVAGDRFGTAVAMEGDLVVIGAPGDTGPGAGSGSAYVFRKDGGVWSQEAKLAASDAAGGDSFGSAVAVSGNAVVIGAPEDDGVGSNSGSAYVFRKNGALWLQEAKLTASNSAAGDGYGVSVGMLGDRVVVGAYGKSGGVGAAYVHRKVGASWSQQFNITKSGTGVFGSAVGITTDTVAIGAPTTNGVGLFSGAAYVYDITTPPTLLSIQPTFGMFDVQTPVTLTGTDFAQFAPATVTFGGVPATNVAWVSSTQRTCTAPLGMEGQVVSVTLTENGAPTTLTDAFTYTGVTTITDVSPDNGPAVGGPPVTITGTHFVNDGSTTVDFGGNAASIVSITPPSTIVVNVPPGARGTTVDVSVDSNNGLATLPNAFTYAMLNVTAINKVGGNIKGGTSLTITVDLGTTVPDTTATVGGNPATVTGVTPTSVTIVTPAVTEATGTALAVSVTNSNGTGTLNNAFTYTPALYAPVTGNTVSGGSVDVDWLFDPGVGPGQVATLWLGNLGPPVSVGINGFAGVLQRLPLIYILNGWPEAVHPVALSFGPLDPVVAGFPLHLQMVVSGEGGPKGSFSNDRLFVIP